MEHTKSLGLLALTSRLRIMVDYFNEEVNAIYAAHDVPFKPKWFTLFSLIATKPGHTLTDAAALIGQTHASVHLNANEMEKAGLIEIAKSKDDERSKALYLTDAGRALLVRLQPVWDKLRARMNEIDAQCGGAILPTIESLEHILHAKPFRQLAKSVNPSEAIIRPFEPRDLKPFGALNEAWLNEFFYIEPEDVKVLSDPYTYIFRPGGEIWVAEVDGKVLGCCALLQHKDGSYELAKMAVDKLAQGYGLGRKLAERIIEQTRERGVKVLYIITNTKLKSAMALYKRLGFVESSVPKHTRYARGNITLELAL